MRYATRFLVGSAAIGLINCADPSPILRPAAVGRVNLSIVPRFAEGSGRVSAALARVGLSYDQVRIVIRRPPADTLKDTTIAFHPGDSAKTLELAVLAAANDTLGAGVRFQQGALVLFEGNTVVTSVATAAPVTASGVVDIVVTYTGPGSTTKKLTIAPGSGTYSSGTTTQFTAKAYDGANAELPNVPIVWSVSDTAVAVIDENGLASPRRQRGTVRVRATAANGVVDSATVTFAPPPTRLRVAQGAAQLGAPGAQLPLPVIIELVAADGLPAPANGLTATFAAGNGGSISPSSIAFDANSRVQVIVTLGGTAGGVFLYTVTAGGFSLTFAEIAVVGPPTQLIPSGPTTFAMVAGVLPDPLPTLRVADAQGNSVSGVSLKLTVQRDGQLLKEPFVVPSDTIGLLAVNAVVSTFASVAGSYSIKVESGNPAVSLAPLVYNVTIEPAAAAKLVFVQQPTNVAVNVAAQPAVKVAIQDQFGNTRGGDTDVISLSMDPATGSGVTITGTGSAGAVNGVATFSSLKFGQTGTGVKIRAVGAGLPASLSAAFNIVP